MASVVAVCISEKKGTMKHQVDHIDVKIRHGILGDAHAGDWHRQISLLASESVDKMKKIYPDIPIGAFAENILTEGIEVSALPIGTKIIVGDAILEITQIGKECHNDCAIRKQVGDCVMPREGVFAIVQKEGTIRSGDEIRVYSIPELKKPSYKFARELLLSVVSPVDTERVPLSCSGGRILAKELIASEDVPAFDRSPYDGYAVRASDTILASEEHPVSLQIIEEIPAGSVPTQTVIPGTAAKILTGAPIPNGADTVVMYEKTAFTKETVTLLSPLKRGDNIILRGEDVHKGTVLAQSGMPIDPGLAGTLAAQNEVNPLVFRKPKVALISIGSELVEACDAPGNGHIRNTNRYTLEALLTQLGCEPVFYGIADDSVDEISSLLEQGLSQCDAVITTGGVSVGDYDLTPAAMESLGVNILFRGVDMKPGMACAYGVKDGKLIFTLSGNPAAALTNLYAIAQPALMKLTGRKTCLPPEFSVILSNDFKKKSPVMRFLRGTLEIVNGVACMQLSPDQGNGILSSMIGCNMMAVVPAGSGPLEAGTVLKGFLL